MLNLPIYLYLNILDVTLDLDATIRGVNQVMYQRELKIQKGIKNQIRIQFKNSDQKKVHISNTQTFVFSMFDAINQRLIVEKELEVLDDSSLANKGLALLTLNESDTLDLDVSSYQFSVKLKDTDGTYLPTYANTYYGMAGTLLVSHDVYPVLKDSAVVSEFARNFRSDLYLYEHLSGNLYSYPEFNGNSALHTIAIYMTKFRGTMYIEGTLDNNPGANGNYTAIVQRIYDDTSGIDYINFNGVYSYIRIRYIPKAGPPPNTSNDDPSYFGSVDKVLYRS